MKKLIAGTFLLSFAIAAAAQSYIALDNIGNTNISPTATSGGLFFFDPYYASVNPHLISQDFNAAFYGGTDSANLTLIRSFSGAGAVGDNVAGAGTFFDLSGGVYAVPGTTTASTTAFFRIEAWLGPSSSFPQIGYANWTTYRLVFSNPVGQMANPSDLTGMPAICLCVIPEPSTVALFGLGLLALWAYRSGSKPIPLANLR